MSTKENKKEELSFQPKKDIPIFIFSVLLIGIVVLMTFLYKKKDSTDSYVEIRYQNRLLYDKEDETKSTSIQFPVSGEKRITFRKEDASYYFTDLNTFSFEGDYVSITLYSDKSIQIHKEDITCSDHVCSNMGRIYETYTPIVCLPNSIQVMIVAKTGFPESVN